MVLEVNVEQGPDCPTDHNEHFPLAGPRQAVLDKWDRIFGWVNTQQCEGYVLPWLTLAHPEEFSSEVPYTLPVQEPTYKNPPDFWWVQCQLYSSVVEVVQGGRWHIDSAALKVLIQKSHFMSCINSPALCSQIPPHPSTHETSTSWQFTFEHLFLPHTATK